MCTSIVPPCTHEAADRLRCTAANVPYPLGEVMAMLEDYCGQADACRVPLEDDRFFRKKSRGDRENVPIPERARSVSAALSIFLPDSYGYRPNKSAIDAVGVTRKRCWQYDFVLEFDIRGLFDNIDHTCYYVPFANT
jgi:hypothetical protein